MNTIIYTHTIWGTKSGLCLTSPYISPKGKIISAKQNLSPPQVGILPQHRCEILSGFAENR